MLTEWLKYKLKLNWTWSVQRSGSNTLPVKILFRLWSGNWEWFPKLRLPNKSANESFDLFSNCNSLRMILLLDTEFDLHLFNHCNTRSAWNMISSCSPGLRISNFPHWDRIQKRLGADPEYSSTWKGKFSSSNTYYLKYSTKEYSDSSSLRLNIP